MKKPRAIVLAYSGGLDTSIIIHWLKQRYRAKVHAVCVDVGQGSELTGLVARARATGADSAIIVDARKEFVRDYIFPCLKSGALYEDKYYLATALARPLIAQKLVEVARRLRADGVSHGATGKGNDQVRFELTFKALAPDLMIIAPWREWELKSRTDEIRYARRHRIPITVTRRKPYSIDKNLWHISYEGGILEDPENAPDESMFEMTVAPERAPARGAVIEVACEEGVPVRLNGRRYDPARLVQELNRIGGAHGVGRTDLVENRLVGMKSRGVYESPAAVILHRALRELEHLVLDRDTFRMRQQLAIRYGELVYYGLWFTPLREALDAFFASVQKRTTGLVRLKLYRGNCIVQGRRSPSSLYSQELATFEEDALYDQKDAAGFINLFGLPLKIHALREMKRHA